MATVLHPPNSRERRNIRELSDAYYDQSSPLHEKALNYLSAWYHITVELSPPNPNSFFVIAGYHGMPFRGAGWGNSQWWGGYCNHGNVLFPTWHRAYIWRLENALRASPNGKDVTLCYWDEIEEENDKEGLPKIFFEEKVTIPTMKGPTENVPNPLHHYTFQHAVFDNIPVDNVNVADYSKPLNYDTVRYPFSGLLNQDSSEQSKIDAYNKTLTDEAARNPKFIPDTFNARLKQWLEKEPRVVKGKTIWGMGLRQKWIKCLEAPEYTYFSNTTSATQYNQEMLNVKGGSPDALIPLESPHNDGHLMVGGFFIPDAGDVNPIAEFKLANGDMGENDTAGFDPIFFHHHCFVDRMFYKWQLKHGKTKEFDIIQKYPGTNSVDSQGPTPGIAGNTWLTMDTVLAPFNKNPDNTGEPMTSRDVMDIAKLGYSYQGLRSDSHELQAPTMAQTPAPTHLVQATGINKGKIAGSFIVASYLDNEKAGYQLLGYQSVLSRWHTDGCANCQTNLGVKVIIPITVEQEDVDKNRIYTVTWSRESLGSNKSWFQGPSLGSPGFQAPGGTVPGHGKDVFEDPKWKPIQKILPLK